MSAKDETRQLKPEREDLNQLSTDFRSNLNRTLGAPVLQLFLDDEYAGSGILVEVDGHTGILTAEHVIFNPKRPFETGKGQTLSTFPQFYSADRLGDSDTQSGGTSTFVDVLRWYPESASRSSYDEPGSEWGPDLGFIRLPKDLNFASNLRAIRINSYQLASQPEARQKRALAEANTILAAVGAPKKWIGLDISKRPGQTTFVIQAGVMITLRERYVRYKDGDDFIDALIDSNPAAVLPESFGGVSGGALWRVRDPFRVDPPMTSLLPEDYVLAGVVFWQEMRTDPRFLRAHGPISLYTTFLPKLRNWLPSPSGIIPVPAGGIIASIDLPRSD